MEDKEIRTLSEEETEQVAGGYGPREQKWIKYHVNEGDTMWYILSRFNCSAADIREWNHLKKTDSIVPGMTLDIYTSNY